MRCCAASTARAGHPPDLFPGICLKFECASAALSRSPGFFRFYSASGASCAVPRRNPMKKWTACAAAAALTVASLSAGAAPAGRSQVEKSPDVLVPGRASKRIPEKAAVPLVLAPNALAAASSPTVEDVGDADSFGRNVIYLGLAQTLPVTVTDDCTGSD